MGSVLVARKAITVEEVNRTVDRIRQLALEEHDEDAAHLAEDELWDRVLWTIGHSSAVRDHKALARAALRTQSIPFQRYTW